MSGSIRSRKDLRAAMDLFSKKGFELTTVEDITRAAHVAKGTFYNFFVKKEDVLLYFLDTEFAKSRKEIERRIKKLSTISEKSFAPFIILSPPPPTSTIISIQRS